MLYTSWRLQNFKRPRRFSEKTLWNIINKDGFFKTNFVHLILFTTLSPSFLRSRFFGNHRQWSVVKFFYSSSAWYKIL